MADKGIDLASFFAKKDGNMTMQEKAMLDAFRDYDNAKRKWAEVDCDCTRLVNRYNELRVELDAIRDRLEEYNKIGKAVKIAKSTIDELLNYDNPDQPACRWV